MTPEIIYQIIIAVLFVALAVTSYGCGVGESAADCAKSMTTGSA